MDLQLYINNIAMCLDIVDPLYARRQDCQQNALIKCYNLIKSQLSINHNKFKQDPSIHFQPKTP